MNSQLNSKQLAAIKLLVAGVSQKDTALQLGVAPETVCRWGKENPFQARLGAELSQIHEENRILMRALTRKALLALSNILDSESANPRTKLLATAQVLSQSQLDRDGEYLFGPEDASEFEKYRALVKYSREQSLIK
jgi:hypothetical protein